jgi:hypothetical protein
VKDGTVPAMILQKTQFASSIVAPSRSGRAAEN